MCLGPRGLLRCGSVHPVSNPSTEPAAVVERSTKAAPAQATPSASAETSDDGQDRVHAEDRSDWRSGLTFSSSFAAIRGGDLTTDHLDTFSFPRVAVPSQMSCPVCGSLVGQFHVFIP